jgi:hypothetical protein
VPRLAVTRGQVTPGQAGRGKALSLGFEAATLYLLWGTEEARRSSGPS